MNNRPEIIVIAAMAKNRVIGQDNDIPWNIAGEQARFKQTTMGHALIMGRKTWQSIGHPLPGRRNIVVTRNPSFTARGADVVNSLEQGLSLCRDQSKIFIIGGEQIYKASLEFADTLILSILPVSVAGDAFFPEFSSKTFNKTSVEQVDGPPPYTINTYSKTGR